MIYIFKIVYYFVLRTVFHLFYLIPVQKDKIIFCSYAGTQYSCNPYYIYKKLLEKYPNRFNVLWISKSLSMERLLPSTTLLYPNGLKYIYHLLTARVIIDNDGMKPYIPFRKKQLLINTWHGGGLFKKNFGKATKAERKYVDYLQKLQRNDIKLFLSSSKAWTDVVARVTFSYKGEVLHSGFPRNDIFFKDYDELTKKVKEELHIPLDKKIVLYAPTFRGGVMNSSRAIGLKENEKLDVIGLINVLELKFHGEFCFLYRGHHNTSGLEFNNSIDVSHYPDMQELLAASDIFISDYSSCLWDFSLTFKPCFIYAPDFEEYVKSPGFESDYNEWPFPIAHSNDEMRTIVKDFCESDYIDRAKQYHKSYGSYEKGNASEIVVDHIIKELALN